MTILFSEGWGKADSTVLGPDQAWTEVFGDSAVAGAQWQVPTVGGADLMCARCNTDTGTSDFYVQVTASTLTRVTAPEVGVAVRFQNAAETYYYFGVGKSATFPNGFWRLESVAAGVETVITASTGYTWASTDIIKLAVSGSTLTCYINGAVVNTVTNTAIASGTKAGVVGYANGSGDDPRSDNFETGTIDVTAATFAVIPFNPPGRTHPGSRFQRSLRAQRSQQAAQPDQSGVVGSAAAPIPFNPPGRTHPASKFQRAQRALQAMRAFTSTVPSGTTYTKAGTGNSDLDASGPKALVYDDTGSGSSDLDASGPKVVTYVKSGTGSSDLDATGPDVDTYADSGTGSSDLDASGAKAVTYVKTGAGASDLDASGAKATVYADSGTGESDLDASGAKAVVYIKTGTGASDLDASGARDAVPTTPTTTGSFRQYRDFIADPERPRGDDDLIAALLLASA